MGPELDEFLVILETIQNTLLKSKLCNNSLRRFIIYIVDLSCINTGGKPFHRLLPLSPLMLRTEIWKYGQIVENLQNVCYNLLQMFDFSNGFYMVCSITTKTSSSITGSQRSFADFRPMYIFLGQMKIFSGQGGQVRLLRFPYSQK